MNREDDELYYARRARQERERAAAASDAAIGTVHSRLAEEYDRRIQGDQARESSGTPF